MEEDDNLFKITCQRCNVFVTLKGRSVELVYVYFLRYEFYTLVIYPEEIDPEISTFSVLPEKNVMHASEYFEER